MRVLGYEVQIRKAVPPLAPVSDSRGGWFPWIREPYAGAWQRDDEWTVDTVLSHHAVYACVSLIANDVGKLRPKLVSLDADGIWTETTSGAFSPVLRRPNRFQNHIQFKEWWTASKLIHGNVYVLKERDERAVVRALYLLDPTRVQILVSPDGAIFYQLGQDNISGIEGTDVVVPASEIIHDRINCLFHPLVGVSPIFAAGMAAHIGNSVEKNAASFFGKGSNPSGLLTTPTHIDNAKAKELQEIWNAAYSGDRSGRVAVLGNDMTFTPLRMTAVESQMIEHLKWTAETVCSAFHVPPFKIGIRDPKYSNAEIANQVYYSDCLQSHIEQFELSMDEGLGIGIGNPKEGKTLGIELDLDGLLRMDNATMVDTLAKGVGGAVLTPNEARKKLDLPPIDGGDTVYLQEQNFSVAALAERDRDKPFSKPVAPTPSTPSMPNDDDAEDEPDDAEMERGLIGTKLRLRALTRTRKLHLLRAA